MKKLILLLIMLTSSFSFASNIDIKNAKIGSTIISDWNILGNDVEGHAAVIVEEYNNDTDSSFIIGSHSGGVRYDSYKNHLEGGDIHLGHYRAVNRNYTFEEREYIQKAAIKAVRADTEYTFVNLYTYNWDINLSASPMWYEDGIPYGLDIMPIKFRCDGLTEWTTELALNPSNPRQADGFYSENNDPLWDYLQPIQIKNSPIDAIGKPDAPTLIKTDTQVNATFSLLSGAYSKALYVLFRSESNHPNNLTEVYCGSNRSYNDPITNDMEGEYFYYLKIGERTASCDDTDTDFSEFSEYSSVTVQQECQSPELFEVLSQTDINTPEWRVSVKNIETNETQDAVLPFNLDGSLYPLDSGEWVLASCGGKAYTTEWENSIGFYTLDNPEEEKIIFDRFKFGRENDLTIIDTKTSLVWNNTNLSLHNWTEANNICEELTLESYEDWRMPTFNELKSILNSESNTHVYEDFFTQLSSIPYGYWSSNTFTSYDMAWSYWLGWYLVEVEESLVLNYTNASYLLLDTKYDINLMCVQAL